MSIHVSVSGRIQCCAITSSGRGSTGLYRRFGVSSYKLIRQEQYAAVLAFLEEWRQSSAE
jgi:hypothetical protein